MSQLLKQVNTMKLHYSVIANTDCDVT